jgi:hypothetical protein
MKILIIVLLMAGPAGYAHAQVNGNKIENVDSIELRKQNVGRFGIVYAAEADAVSEIVVYCREKDTIADRRAEVCARMPVITKFSSVGFTATLELMTIGLQTGFELRNYNGKSLRDFFGNYYGVQAGFAYIVGAKTVPFLMNRNGVISHNFLRMGILAGEIDISAVKMQIIWPRDSSTDIQLLDKTLVSN